MAGPRGRSASDNGKEELPKAKLSGQTLKRSARLFGYMGKHRWKFFVGLVFLFLTASVALIFPRLLGELMGIIGAKDGIPSLDVASKLKDTYLNADVKTRLLYAADRVGIYLLILFSLQAIFSFFRVYMFAQATENMLAKLRQATYERLLGMPMTYFSRNQAAELSSRLSTDISQIGDTLTTGIAEFLRQLIIAVGGIIIICFISWKLALVMVAIVPPVALITVFFGRKIRKHSRGMQDKIAESNIIVTESVQGIANVKSFTNEGYEIGRYTKSTSQIVQQAIRFAMARGGFFAFIILCLFGSMILMVWYGVHMTVNNELTAGQMLSFLFYTLFVSASFGGLPEQYAQLQRAVGASERVFEMLGEDIEHINTKEPRPRGQLRLKGDVVFRNTAFVYPTRKDFRVLENISFEAKPGQTIAIVGPSGSGKSTLAQLLLRFYDPEKGEILFDGKDARNFDLTELRENMAIVPQDVLLFGGTIRENIAYGKPGATDAEVHAAAAKANALTFIESFPDKFETKVGDRGIQLSGGQRQRIAIARAVLKDPSILILDEATSSLDSESERVVQEALDKLMIGRTSFVIAHRLSTVRNADKIIVIEKGKVVETGTHDELMEIENGLYRSLSRLQFQSVN
ncbi:MAG TPA: ABC transporter ATP-binding protein [Bacteroidia bacterium]|jgi:ABC-type multidrug transport system fused ATPase/permease subunit|nr:ABC transporter ATP-binding protein [Bacteroidia bacterium]